MTRLMLTAAVLVIPVSGLAQTVPVPPPPPAPPAPVVLPAPPELPIPPGVPRPVDLTMPVLVSEMALAEALVAAEGAQARIMSAEEARVVSERALAESRQAMDEARWRMEDMRFAWAGDQVVTFGSSNSAYDSGLSLMSRRDYERAIARFDQVIAAKASRVDAALYHKAYALYRLGRSSDATATLAELRKNHPQSRYLKDASALETAVRQSAGQSVDPSAVDNDELKLLAINALVHTDPAQALPLLEGVLNNGANSHQLKTRALFVLAQSNQPRAREILMSLAKGAGNPDLQRSAIQYLSSRGRERITSAELKAIYDSTSDADIKRAVIGAWGTMGEYSLLANVVAAERADTAVRSAALSRMTDPAAADTLWAIYQKEQDKELRGSILSRLGSMGVADRLLDVVRTEQDAELRRRAIRSLGNMRADKSGAALSELYGRESDADNKKAIISALANQNNGEALVALARKETNMTLKRDIVSRLSNMTRNKAAMDYMLEIIK